MYREVTMIEFREVLRLWQEQVPKKRIAARLGLDPKTVRRYLWAAEAAGLQAQLETLSDEQRCAMCCWLYNRVEVVPTAKAGPAAVNNGRRSNAG